MDSHSWYHSLSLAVLLFSFFSMEHYRGLSGSKPLHPGEGNVCRFVLLKRGKGMVPEMRDQERENCSGTESQSLVYAAVALSLSLAHKHFAIPPPAMDMNAGRRMRGNGNERNHSARKGTASQLPQSPQQQRKRSVISVFESYVAFKFPMCICLPFLFPSSSLLHSVLFVFFSRPGSQLGRRDRERRKLGSWTTCVEVCEGHIRCVPSKMPILLLPKRLALVTTAC